MTTNASAILIVTKQLRELAMNSEIAASREKPPFDEIYNRAALRSTVAANLIEELVKDRDAAAATITALRKAADILGQQLDFKAGKRRKAWDGSFIDEIRSHASPGAQIAGKPIMGCMVCAGTGISNESEALSPCPHCFAGFETPKD